MRVTHLDLPAASSHWQLLTLEPVDTVSVVVAQIWAQAVGFCVGQADKMWMGVADNHYGAGPVGCWEGHVLLGQGTGRCLC